MTEPLPGNTFTKLRVSMSCESKGAAALVAPRPSAAVQIPLFTRYASRRPHHTMKTCIEDEFTRLPIPRHRKYNLRVPRDKRCPEGGDLADFAPRSLTHLVRPRERQRKKRGHKRRYYGTPSYRREKNPRAWYGGKPP